MTAQLDPQKKKRKEWKEKSKTKERNLVPPKNHFVQNLFSNANVQHPMSVTFSFSQDALKTHFESPGMHQYSMQRRRNIANELDF